MTLSIHLRSQLARLSDVLTDAGHHERMDEGTPDPAGPLDNTSVYACEGCGCLVVDQKVHELVCPGNTPAGDRTPPPPLGPQIVEWLETLDPSEVTEAAYAEAGFDADPTTAVFDRLKKLAAAL